MERGTERQNNWKRTVAVLIASASALLALAALRGPDQIAGATATSTGEWLLSGPSLWNAQTLFSAIAAPAYALAGPRAWQNLHVLVAFLAIAFWLLPLRLPSWRGMAPLIPTLLAAVLSTSDSGFTGFGLAVAVLSAWRWITFDRAISATSFPFVAWVAAWLSAGALPVIAAFLAEGTARWTRNKMLLALLGAIAAANLTPRGLSVGSDAWTYIFWTPSPAPGTAAVAAVFLSVIALALALRWSLAKKCVGTALAPAGLLVCASQGQVAYLWAAALMMIPFWTPAREQLCALGVNVRWWAATALIVFAASLAIWSGSQRLNDWYNLAMVRETAQATLTRDAVPQGGPVYINPQGLALARFGGPLPPRSPEGENLRLAREPKLWRAQDRTARYRAVWLLGEKSDYAPLARHLGESPDWRLAAVDATGLLFVRAPREREFATEPAQQLSRGLVGAANRSRFLADAALASLAAQALPEADELSRAAVRRSDMSSHVAAARALVLISIGQIGQALEQSERAVSLTPDSAGAWLARAETLLHAGRADDAYAAGQRAADLAPGDEGALWLAARTANAARALQTEAEILERLIALTEGRGGDASFYELYLGQSYAKQGLARPALRYLQKAADAPGLSDEQRAELQEEIARVRESAERN